MEPVNALLTTVDLQAQPPKQCGCGGLKERIDALETRLDHVEHTLAIESRPTWVCSFSRVLRKYGLGLTS